MTLVHLPRTPLALALCGLLAVTAFPPSSADDPVATPFTNHGIGPGAQLVIRVPTPAGVENHGCTANWVWKDQDGALYLGTAGHCFFPEKSAYDTGSGPNPDYDLAGIESYVCRSLCYFGGQAGGQQWAGRGSASASGATIQPPRPSVSPGPVPVPGDWVQLGAVAYARQQVGADGIGNDFGLIAIPDSLLGDVNAAMAFWGGPYGVASGAVGDFAVLHGNAGYLAETFATKSRAGRFTSFGEDTFVASVPTAAGDSGSAVGRIADAGADTNWTRVEAAGIQTHEALCEVGPTNGGGVGPVSCAQGTTIGRAQELAEEADLCVEVVLVTEDLLDLEPADDCLA